MAGAVVGAGVAGGGVGEGATRAAGRDEHGEGHQGHREEAEFAFVLAPGRGDAGHGPVRRGRPPVLADDSRAPTRGHTPRMETPHPYADAWPACPRCATPTPRSGPSVEAGAPWPLAEHFGTEPEASWGPRELLAHVARDARLLARRVRADRRGRPRQPGTACPSGARAATRCGSGSWSATGPCRCASCSGGSRRGSGAGRHAWRRPRRGRPTAVGLHPRLGEMTAGDVVGRMILVHLGEHRDQLEAILAAR